VIIDRGVFGVLISLVVGLLALIRVITARVKQGIVLGLVEMSGSLLARSRRGGSSRNLGEGVDALLGKGELIMRTSAV
jgi:hypothetical protein